MICRKISFIITCRSVAFSSLGLVVILLHVYLFLHSPDHYPLLP